MNAWTDGPGVGFGPPGLMLAFFFAPIGFGWLIRSAWRKTRRSRHSSLALLAGLGLAIAFIAGDAPRRLLAWRWETDCGRGQTHACWAAGDLYAHGLGVRMDPQRAAALHRRACTAHDLLGCGRLLELESATAPEVCAHVTDACGQSSFGIPRCPGCESCGSFLGLCANKLGTTPESGATATHR
jgi:hypothetical protein